MIVNRLDSVIKISSDKYDIVLYPSGLEYEANRGVVPMSIEDCVYDKETDICVMIINKRFEYDNKEKLEMSVKMLNEVKLNLSSTGILGNIEDVVQKIDTCIDCIREEISE